MMRTSLIFILLSFALVGQTPQPRVVTTTRLVAIFSRIEDDWLNAIQQKDRATLDRLLARDFEVWTPAPPGAPLPREQWLQQALSEKLDSFQIEQMAVRSVNDSTAVVSFVLTKTVERAGKPQTSNFFIVDIWQKKNNENWQVTDRYSSEVTSGVPSKQGEVRPTGKD